MAPFPSPTSTWHDKTYPSISPSRPELSAKGKAVLVTGGGTGIGAETALYFAEAGASRIALLGRREQPLLDTKTRILEKFPTVEIFTAATDVTKKSQVDKAFGEFAAGGNGTVDILISAAAMIGPQEPVKDVDSERFLDAINLNMAGSLYVSQAFLRVAAAKDAVVVDVNSSAAHLSFPELPGFAAYSIAKLAVFRLWDSIANANPALRVYHIQPGIVDTAMNKESGGVEAVGFEDDVSLPASFSVWIASEEARFLKGKFIWANWDVDELKARAKELEDSPELTIGLVGWPWAGVDSSFE